jgi:2-oxoisovalerate dehydrogenase E1 component
MEVAVSSASESVSAGSGSLSPRQLVEVYRLMVLSRRVDDREILLKRQQKTYFQISGAGHEALGVGAALAMRPGYDWFFPYYRDRALCLALGVTPLEMLLQAVGAATDPASGGRQMPTHWSSRALNIVSTSSATASQLLHAVGCAEAGRYFSGHPEAATKADGDYRAFREVKFHGDEVVLTLLGEGSTSQGEFWEAMNTAANRKLPVIFCVEDNGYAISTPVEVSMPGGNISRLVANHPKWTAPMRRPASGPFNPLWPTAAPGWVLPLFTATVCGPTPTRSPTTTGSIVPRPSAKQTRCEIRW